MFDVLIDHSDRSHTHVEANLSLGEGVRMSKHVDIVQNHWVTGIQQIVAEVHALGGELTIEDLAEGNWTEVVQRPVFDVETGEHIEPSQHPERFLEALSENLAGTYLFATPPHDDLECQFQQSRRLQMERERYG